MSTSSKKLTLVRGRTREGKAKRKSLPTEETTDSTDTMPKKKEVSSSQGNTKGNLTGDTFSDFDNDSESSEGNSSNEGTFHPWSDKEATSASLKKAQSQKTATTLTAEVPTTFWNGTKKKRSRPPSNAEKKSIVDVLIVCGDIQFSQLDLIQNAQDNDSLVKGKRLTDPEREKEDDNKKKFRKNDGKTKNSQLSSITGKSSFSDEERKSMAKKGKLPQSHKASEQLDGNESLLYNPKKRLAERLAKQKTMKQNTSSLQIPKKINSSIEKKRNGEVKEKTSNQSDGFFIPKKERPKIEPKSLLDDEQKKKLEAMKASTAVKNDSKEDRKFSPNHVKSEYRRDRETFTRGSMTPPDPFDRSETNRGNDSPHPFREANPVESKPNVHSHTNLEQENIKNARLMHRLGKTVTSFFDSAGSLDLNDDDSLDFFDKDDEGNVVQQPKIPMLEADFSPQQPNWPLSWWGIVEPPKETDRGASNTVHKMSIPPKNGPWNNSGPPGPHSQRRSFDHAKNIYQDQNVVAVSREDSQSQNQYSHGNGLSFPYGNNKRSRPYDRDPKRDSFESGRGGWNGGNYRHRDSDRNSRRYR